MSQQKIDLNSFLEEMVSLTSERLKKQDKVIEDLRKEVETLKKTVSTKTGLKVDKAVLKVLRERR